MLTSRWGYVGASVIFAAACVAAMTVVAADSAPAVSGPSYVTDSTLNANATSAANALADAFGFTGSLTEGSANPVWAATGIVDTGLQVSVTELPTAAVLQSWQAAAGSVPVTCRLVPVSWNGLVAIHAAIKPTLMDLGGRGLDIDSFGPSAADGAEVVVVGSDSAPASLAELTSDVARFGTTVQVRTTDDPHIYTAFTSRTVAPH